MLLTGKRSCQALRHVPTSACRLDPRCGKTERSCPSLLQRKGVQGGGGAAAYGTSHSDSGMDPSS